MTSKSNLTKIQRFEVVRINRRSIVNAPYNPRKINSENYKVLKRNLKRVGLIETLVWNKTTGNMVSGHQRLKIMDEIEQRDDYDLDVAQVEMDEKTEKEQNIFMNNPNSQGDWDRELLMKVFPDIDLENAGLNDIDINNIGIEFDLKNYKNEEVEGIIDEFDRINAENKQKAIDSHENDENHKDWKKVKESIKKNITESDNVDTFDSYIVLTFDSHKAKALFAGKFGMEEDVRYIKGEMIEKFIRNSS